MSQAACSKEDFIALFEQYGPAETARRLGVTDRNVLSRRVNIEKLIGRQITGPPHPAQTRHDISHPYRICIDVPDGIVLVGGDAHYYPFNPPTPAHRAFVSFCKELKPKVVIMNGDAFDGARISKHPPIGWEKQPSVVDELEEVALRLGEIERASPQPTRLTYPLGNHCSRFETRLATVAPEYAKIHGFHLKDHIGHRWESCWSTWINSDTVVKHRNRGGMHAAHSNALWSGKNIVTGHTHQLKISAIPDYNGVRWGIEHGCLADPYGPQFVDYTEDNPRMWQAGFVVLTFRNGVLLQPEAVRVFDNDHVDFRGSVVKIQ